MRDSVLLLPGREIKSILVGGRNRECDAKAILLVLGWHKKWRDEETWRT